MWNLIEAQTKCEWGAGILYSAPLTPACTRILWHQNSPPRHRRHQPRTLLKPWIPDFHFLALIKWKMYLQKVVFCFRCQNPPQQCRGGSPQTSTTEAINFTCSYCVEYTVYDQHSYFSFYSTFYQLGSVVAGHLRFSVYTGLNALQKFTGYITQRFRLVCLMMIVFSSYIYSWSRHKNACITSSFNGRNWY